MPPPIYKRPPTPRDRFLAELVGLDFLLHDAEKKRTGATIHLTGEQSAVIRNERQLFKDDGDDWSKSRFGIGTERLKTAKHTLRLLIAGKCPKDARRLGQRDARPEGWTPTDEKWLQAELAKKNRKPNTE